MMRMNFQDATSLGWRCAKYTYQHAKHAGTRGFGGIPPRKILKKQMLKYCNLETFPHKMQIFYILPLDYWHGSLQHFLMERFGQVQTANHMMHPLTIAFMIMLKLENFEFE